MPITADLGGKNYTLGRGKVYFDRFAPNAVVNAALQGEGERYLGNTPEFSTSSSSEDLDHFDSDAGVRTKDDSVQLSFDRTGSFTCDNISTENIAMYFLSDGAEILSQSAATASTATFTASRGRFYQLGVSTGNPSGVRNVSNVVVKKGAGFTTTVVASGNYEVDEVLGRIYVEADSVGIPDDTPLQVTFDVAAGTRERIVSKNQSIYGAIRFVADNPKGANRDYYIPYVKLSPDGDYNFKGDEWQTMSFNMEILKKASNIESMYVDGRPIAP